MKISEAQPTYYNNRRVLVDQIRSLSDKKNKAEERFKLTGDDRFSNEAATLTLSLEATQKAFDENQKVLDSMAEQWCAVSNLESSKQQGEAAAKEFENLGKIMTVFRRMIRGDIVPMTDEKKLMEFDDKLYTAAKNMQTMAMQMEKEHEKHKSLWEDEEEETPPDPAEIADNSEYTGELPDIEIPEAPDISES